MTDTPSISLQCTEVHPALRIGDGHSISPTALAFIGLVILGWGSGRPVERPRLINVNVDELAVLAAVPDRVGISPSCGHRLPGSVHRLPSE